METVARALNAFWDVTILDRIHTRPATLADVPAIRGILNEAIAARAAFDQYPKELTDIRRWLEEHDERYVLLVSVDEDGHILGCGGLNRYQPPHDAHDGVADLSVYLASGAQRQGLGTRLMTELETHARNHDFHKIVARTFPANRASRRLLRKFGYRVVGVYKRDAVIDGDYVDVMIVEKLLSPGRYRVGVPSDE
jgi:L-amino acid N-acyltransferase YncA